MLDAATTGGLADVPVMRRCSRRDVAFALALCRPDDGLEDGAAHRQQQRGRAGAQAAGRRGRQPSRWLCPGRRDAWSAVAQSRCAAPLHQHLVTTIGGVCFNCNCIMFCPVVHPPKLLQVTVTQGGYWKFCLSAISPSTVLLLSVSVPVACGATGYHYSVYCG
jgi:hypothetical protein